MKAVRAELCYINTCIIHAFVPLICKLVIPMCDKSHWDYRWWSSGLRRLILILSTHQHAVVGICVTYTMTESWNVRTCIHVLMFPKIFSTHKVISSQYYLVFCPAVFSILAWPSNHLFGNNADLQLIPQIAKVLGPVGPRWAPCWPHEPCY